MSHPSTDPGRLVFLNGTTCAGKSTLALALQQQLEEAWFVIDIDGFLAGRPLSHPRWTADDVQHRLYTGFHHAIAAFLAAGTDVILATIVPWHDAAVMAQMTRILGGFEVLYIGVRCPIDVAEARATARGDDRDRLHSQFPNIHRYSPYDLEVDTETNTPGECAEAAAARVHAPETWRAFGDLALRLREQARLL